MHIPCPVLMSSLSAWGPHLYISTLDLTKGYWQVGLTEAAKEKTAFSTPDGLYQYRVLPFGVHGVPTTFQRLMNHVLRPHQRYAAAYLDNIIIYSRNWEDHLRQLEAVLGALRRANLTANPKNVTWAWRRPTTWVTQWREGSSASDREAGEHRRMATAGDKKTGKNIPWSNWLLSTFHSPVCHPRYATAQAHPGPEAESGEMDDGGRDLIPGFEGHPQPGPGPHLPRLPGPFVLQDRRLGNRPGGCPVSGHQ